MTEGGFTTLQRVQSGITGLDVILEGGFLKGGLYIIQGPPGSGKTTLANQICFHNVAGMGSAVYVTLLAEYHARMMQHLGVMTFFDTSKIPDQLIYLNGLATVHDSGLKPLVALLRKEVTSRRASVLVIDGIVAARRAAPDDQAFSQFVHELQAVAIASQCTVFILASAPGNQIEPEHTMVDGIVELADQLTGWSSVSSLQVTKFRGSSFLRGKHAYKISNRGILVYPRIEALLARPSQPDRGGDGKVTSGIAQFDPILGGGLPEASTTMVMGPSGVGKTTFGLNFLSACSEAEPGLLFGFYETPKRIDAKVAGVCPSLRNLIDDGIIEILWQPPSDDLLDAYGERLLEAVRRRRVKRLFIDGLGALRDAAASSDSRRISMFLTTLMNEMRVLGVTTVYTLEVPNVVGPGVTTSLGDLSSLGENLVLLRFVEVGAQLHRLISVLKLRDSQFDQSLHEYRTSDLGLVIDPTSDGAHDIMTASARPSERSGVVATHPLARPGR